MEEELPPRFRFVSWTFFFGFGFGAFVGVALALLAVAFARGDQKSQTVTSQLPGITDSPAPAGTRSPATPTPDSRSRTTAETDVHIGPGPDYAVVGTLQRGEAVAVVGRDASSGWVAIAFPPGSPARGWVPVSSLDSVSGLDNLAVALPTPLPRSVTIPSSSSSSSSAGAGGGSSATASSSPSVGLTPTAVATAGAPTTPTPRSSSADLAVTRVSLLANGSISVTIANRGPGDLTGQPVFVLVRDLSVHSEMLISPSRTFAAGATMTLQTTSFRVDSETTIQAVVDPNGATNDPDRSNNTLQVNLSPPLALSSH